MYLDFFGLRQQPFGVTPDPAFLYLSRAHREVLDALRSDLVTDRGFMALVGEPGLGKTTLLYKLLDEWSQSSRVVFLFQTQCDSRDFFRYLLAELGVDPEGMSLVAMHHKLNHFLFQEMLAGRRFVLIVDEAQNLDDSVLETVRGLSNFETQHAKLLNIVLAGQSQLADKLASPGLRQLRQRIGLLNRLHPLTSDETAEYIKHRLRLVGYSGDSIFTTDALQAIAHASQGTPRTINHLCHQALSAAATTGNHCVNLEITQNVIARLEGRSIEVQPTPVHAPVVATPVEGVAAVPTEIEPAPVHAPVVATPVEVATAVPTEVEPGPDAAPIPINVLAQAPVPASNPVSTPRAAVSSSNRPAVPPATVLSYGWSKKTNSKGSRSAAVAACILVLLGAALAIPSVRQFAMQEYRSLTSSIFGKLPDSVGAASPESLSATTIALPAHDAGLEDSGVIVVSPRSGQTLEELSRLYTGRFDPELNQQIVALNPDLKDPGHLDAGQLIRLPLLPGTLKKGVDTDDLASARQSGTWQLVVGKVKEIFSDIKH